MAVEAETGEVSWLNPSIGAMFTGMGGAGESDPRSIAGSADGWREARDEIVPGVVEDLLVPVRRNGDLVAIEAADGTTIRWTLENLMDVVQHVEHGPLGVLLAGESRGDDGSTIPVIALVTSDGEVARRWELDAVLDREIRWIRQSPLGEVVWGTSDGIAWRGLRPGDGSADERWSLRRPHLRESWEAWTPSGRLMVRERSDRISSWRRRDGLPLAEIGDAAADGPVDAAKFEQLLETGDGRAAAIYGDRIHMLDRVGATLGLDAVHADRNYLLGAVAEDGAVVLSFEGAGPVADANGTPRTEFTYAIYRFGIEDGGRQLGPALELRTLGPRFDTMRLREGWILLSSPASTVAIPLR